MVSLKMGNSPDNDGKEDLEATIGDSGEEQNENHSSDESNDEESSSEESGSEEPRVDAEKAGSIKSAAAVEANPEVDTDAKSLNGSEPGSSGMSSPDNQSSPKPKQPDPESKENIDDASSTTESNKEHAEGKSHDGDDRSADRIGSGLQSPTVSERSRRSDEEKVNEEEVNEDNNQQNSIRDDCEEDEGRQKSDSKEMRMSQQSSLVEPPSKPFLADETPMINSTNNEALVADNALQLKDLEVLLRQNPSEAKPPATPPVNESRNPELKQLEDLLLDSTPSRIQSKNSIEDNEIQANTEPVSELKSLEQLLNSSIPSGIQSNPISDDPASGGEDEIQAETEQDSEFKTPGDSMSASSPLRTQPSSTSDDHAQNEEDEIEDDTYSPPALKPSNAESALPEEVAPSSDRQLSVFSDTISGQEYLRNVSNAKKELKQIEDEITSLNGPASSSEQGRIADNSSRHYVKNERTVLPFEKDQSTQGARSQKPKNKNKSPKQKQRGAEPPPRNKEEFDRPYNPSDEKRKTKRKNPKKNRIRPEKEKRKGPIDPVGKGIPRGTYSDKEKDRDASASFNERQMERDKSTSPNNVNTTEQSRNRNDPPMVLRGNMEVEGAPTFWNGDHLSVEKKSKKKKSKKKKRREEELKGRDMNSVTSSRMDRGDEEEIGGVPRHVDTKKPDHLQKDDPWEEIPCSWCCRYLPHNLVVATTHAYRLEHADKKEDEFLD
jgi:hypothetical protein